VSVRSPKASTPPLALTAARAAAALDMSEDHFRAEVAPYLKWVRLGRKRIVAVTELERWLEANGSRVLEGEL
jgi:hypothetical protein